MEESVISLGTEQDKLRDLCDVLYEVYFTHIKLFL